LLLSVNLHNPSHRL